ncbi:TrmB family transcriptional regulator [Cohnella nanjingensis]|uniref:TrmB family transcriptional regulator n=1 Tax=Cohnella nanjingensis TaxID=1387779 RepID=A0A7X0VIP3_9BACL|nr:TrmB family transcriptional regulator [Cohnella nanjingensis]MBB6675412.1 TrmB family transcriptional regulator [Cohnella nanjingensis]
MLERLKKLGFSELEGRCYLTLHEEAQLSGYEVAKRVSISRTNVYAALRSLTDKGVCRTIDGDPVRYSAVPIEQVVKYLRSEFDETADALMQELKPPLAAPAFYNWQGDDAVRMAIKRMVLSAARTIIVDIWSEDFLAVEDLLLEAERRGVTVVAITLGPVQSKLKHVLTHKRMEMWHATDARSFYVLCDWKAGFLGAFGGSRKMSALETDHPSVTEMLTQAFHHDILMMDMERDFGAELAEAYGDNYEKLLNHYRTEKGWEIP